MPIADRMKLAEGRPLRRKMMAAMAQQDCGQCGYNCNDYSDAIAGRTATARSVSVIRDILLSCRTTPTTATLSVDAPLSVNQSSTLVAIRTPARVRRTKSPSRH